MSGLADLHRHLDGSLRPDTVVELAHAKGLVVPADLRFEPGMGLHEALARFGFLLSLLDDLDSVRRVASEICEDATADGVTTLEIRFAPQLHGPPIEAVVDAVVEGCAGRAGLVLCGLYGEDPAVLQGLVDMAAERRDVVGIDLAGGPAEGHRWNLADYGPPFQRAESLGLGRTVHAGEGRPPSEIRTAIEVLGAQRVGHGTTLLQDPAVLELVVDKQITIEACPTSNVHTGVVASVSEHPLVEWVRRGVPVCVCTDNTFLSEITLTEELQRVQSIPGFDSSTLDALNRSGHDAAFPRLEA